MLDHQQHAEQAIHEIGCDDFCRACRGRGRVGSERCLTCDGLGHRVASRRDVRWPTIVRSDHQ